MKLVAWDRGNGSIKTFSITLKIAVEAPMPSASVGSPPP